MILCIFVTTGLACLNMILVNVIFMKGSHLEVRVIAMFCSDSQVIYCLGSNCFCCTANVDRMWEIICVLFSGLYGFLRYVFVFDPIFPFISHSFISFYHFDWQNIFKFSGSLVYSLRSTLPHHKRFKNITCYYLCSSMPLFVLK